MASASNTIRLLFLTSTFILFTFFTNAVDVSDSDLITFVCSKTDKPSLCQTTLKSDPTWITTDVHGLSDITLKQATDKANYIPQYLDSVSARAEPELVVKYVACSVDFETVVIPKLTEADTSFKGGNVKAGSQAVISVLSQIDVCLDRFKQPPQDMSQFTSLSLEIQTLCQALSAVADLVGGR